MGTQEDVLLDEVQRRLEETKGKTIAKALIGPVVGALTGSPRGVVDAFMAPSEAKAKAKHEIQQDLILETLARVADAVEAGRSLARAEAVPWLSIAGTIKADGVDVDEVTGLDIGESSGPVVLEPQTKITARGERARSVTGMSVKSRHAPGLTSSVRLCAADGVPEATARVEVGVRCRFCGHRAGVSSTLTVGREAGPPSCPACGKPLD